jgi:hypothetical protein
MKSRPVGAELFEVDGRRERHDEAGSRLSQFCENRLNHCIFPTQCVCVAYDSHRQYHLFT